jgi:hypothetical protein
MTPCAEVKVNRQCTLPRNLCAKTPDRPLPLRRLPTGPSRNDRFGSALVDWDPRISLNGRCNGRNLKPSRDSREPPGPRLLAMKSATGMSVLVIAIGTLVLVASGIKEHLAHHRDLDLRRPYSAGDTLPRLAGIDYADSARTLVLFIDGSRFCREAAPLYRRLAAEHGADVSVAAATHEKIDWLREFLSGNAIAVAASGTYRREALRIHACPTLVLVDRRGVVDAAWFGPLGPRGRDRLRKAIGAKGDR